MNKKIRRFVAKITLAMFMFSLSGTQYLYAGFGSLFLGSQISVDNIMIDSKYGKILEKFKGIDNKLVICIQDLHCNAKAQENIYSILEVLKSKYKNEIKNISVEGAWGELDLSFMKNITTKYDLKNKLTNALINRGYMTGAEKFGVDNKNIKIIGVENPYLYIQNGIMLEKNFDVRDKALFGINRINNKIEQFKNELYSKNLIQFEKLVNDYRQKNNKNFTDYVNELKQYAEKVNISFNEKYPNLEKVLVMDNKIKNIKNISSVKTEAGLLLNEIKNYLSKEELNMLVNFKKYNEDVFYICLNNLLRTKNLNIGNGYPVLSEYLKYIDIKKSINEIEMLEETASLEFNIKNNIAKTRDQKEIVYLEKYLDLLKKYITNSITVKQTKEYLDEENNFYTRLESFIKRNESDISWEYGVSNYFQFIKFADNTMKGFYSIAEKRNTYLTSHMLEQNNKVNVIVTGGYHSSGITQILRSKGISYILVSSNCSDEDNNEIYYKRLKNQFKLFKNKNLNLYPNAYSALSIFQKNVDLDEKKKMIYQQFGFETIAIQNSMDINSLWQNYRDFFKIQLTAKGVSKDDIGELIKYLEKQLNIISPIKIGKKPAIVKAISDGSLKIIEDLNSKISNTFNKKQTSIRKVTKICKLIKDIHEKSKGQQDIDIRIIKDVKDLVVVELKTIQDVPENETVDISQLTDLKSMGISLIDLPKSKDSNINAERSKLISDIYMCLWNFYYDNMEKLNEKIDPKDDPVKQKKISDRNKEIKEVIPKLLKLCQEYSAKMIDEHPVMTIMTNNKLSASSSSALSDTATTDATAVSPTATKLFGITDDPIQLRKSLNNIAYFHGLNIKVLMNIKVFDSTNWTDPIQFHKILQEYADKFGMTFIISLEKQNSLKNDKPGMNGIIDRIDNYIDRSFLEGGPIILLPDGGSKTRSAEKIVQDCHADLNIQQLDVEKCTLTNSLDTVLSLVFSYPKEYVADKIFIMANDQKCSIVNNIEFYNGIEGKPGAFVLFGPDYLNKLIKELNKDTKINISNIAGLNNIKDPNKNSMVKEWVKKYVENNKWTAFGMFFVNKEGKVIRFFEKANRDVLTDYIFEHAHEIDKICVNAFIDITTKSLFFNLYDSQNILVTIPKGKTDAEEKDIKDYYNTDQSDKLRLPVKKIWMHEASFFQTLVQAASYNLDEWMLIRENEIKKGTSGDKAIKCTSIEDWKYIWLVVHLKNSTDGITEIDKKNMIVQILHDKEYNKDEIEKIVGIIPQLNFYGANVSDKWSDVGNPEDELASFISDAKERLANPGKYEFLKMKKSNNIIGKGSKISSAITISFGNQSGQNLIQQGLVLENTIIDGGGELIIQGVVVLHNTHITIPKYQKLIIGNGVAISSSRFSATDITEIQNDVYINRIIVYKDHIHYFDLKDKGVKFFGSPLTIPAKFFVAGVPYKHSDDVVFCAMFNPYKITFKGMALNKFFTGGKNNTYLHFLYTKTFLKQLAVMTDSEKSKFFEDLVNKKLTDVLTFNGKMKKHTTDGKQITYESMTAKQVAVEFVLNAILQIFDYLKDNADDVNYIRQYLDQIIITINNQGVVDIRDGMSLGKIIHDAMDNLYSKKYKIISKDFFEVMGIPFHKDDFIKIPRFPGSQTQEKYMSYTGLSTYSRIRAYESHLDGLFKALEHPQTQLQLFESGDNGSSSSSSSELLTSPRRQRIIKSPNIGRASSPTRDNDRQWGGKEALLELIKFLREQLQKTIITYKDYLEAIEQAIQKKLFQGSIENDAKNEIAQSMGVNINNVFIAKKGFIRPAKIGDNVMVSERYLKIYTLMRTKSNLNAKITEHEKIEQKIVEVKFKQKGWTNIEQVNIDQMIAVLDEAHNEAIKKQGQEEADILWHIEQMLNDAMDCYDQNDLSGLMDKLVQLKNSGQLTVESMDEIHKYFSSKVAPHIYAGLAECDFYEEIIDVTAKNENNVEQHLKSRGVMKNGVITENIRGKHFYFAGDMTMFQSNLNGALVFMKNLSEQAKTYGGKITFVFGPITTQNIKKSMEQSSSSSSSSTSSMKKEKEKNIDWNVLANLIKIGAVGACAITRKGTIVTCGNAISADMITYVRKITDKTNEQQYPTSLLKKDIGKFINYELLYTVLLNKSNKNEDVVKKEFLELVKDENIAKNMGEFSKCLALYDPNFGLAFCKTEKQVEGILKNIPFHQVVIGAGIDFDFTLVSFESAEQQPVSVQEKNCVIQELIIDSTSTNLEVPFIQQVSILDAKGKVKQSVSIKPPVTLGAKKGLGRTFFDTVFGSSSISSAVTQPFGGVFKKFVLSPWKQSARAGKELSSDKLKSIQLTASAA
jgi:hypothetical protein